MRDRYDMMTDSLLAMVLSLQHNDLITVCARWLGTWTGRGRRLSVWSYYVAVDRLSIELFHVLVIILVGTTAAAGSRLGAECSGVGSRRRGTAVLGGGNEESVTFLRAAAAHVVLMLWNAVDADAVKVEPQLTDITLNPRHFVT